MKVTRQQAEKNRERVLEVRAECFGKRVSTGSASPT